MLWVSSLSGKEQKHSLSNGSRADISTKECLSWNCTQCLLLPLKPFDHGRGDTLPQGHLGGYVVGEREWWGSRGCSCSPTSLLLRCRGILKQQVETLSPSTTGSNVSAVAGISPLPGLCPSFPIMERRASSISLLYPPAQGFHLDT